MKQNVKLLKKEMVANGTMAFHFEKPEGFEFRAGQFGDITLINPPETDEEGNIRGFSIATAPHEADIVMATRLRDTAFKRVLRNLSEGSEVVLDAPYGDFTLHKTESTPAVFLIGGIGVTPVRSMIADATHNKTSHKLTLIHANKTEADAPFADDFKKFATENSNFKYIQTVDEATEGWTGEVGRIDREMLRRQVEDINAPIYYLSGPAGMVQAMRKMLVEAEVNEDNIRTEEFDGY